MRSLGYCSDMTKAVSESRQKWLLPEMESQKKKWLEEKSADDSDFEDEGNG